MQVQELWDTIAAMKMYNRNGMQEVHGLHITYRRGKGSKGRGAWNLRQPGSSMPQVRTDKMLLEIFGKPCNYVEYDVTEATRPPPAPMPAAYARPPPGPLPPLSASPNGTACCITGCKLLFHQGWFRHNEECAGAEHFTTMKFRSDEWAWVAPPLPPPPELAPVPPLPLAATAAPAADDLPLKKRPRRAAAIATAPQERQQEREPT